VAEPKLTKVQKAIADALWNYKMSSEEQRALEEFMKTPKGLKMAREAADVIMEEAAKIEIENRMKAEKRKARKRPPPKGASR
jgi:hypothetical protein